jgi:hypothetical protein
MIMTQANPNPDASKPAGSEAPKKKSLGKKILIGLGVLVGVVVLFVLLLPTLLSTNAGKNFILGYVNDAISGKVEVDSISLGWFSGQSITGVKVVDPSGQTVATVAKIDMPSVRPTTFLDMSNDLGTITIDKPEVNLVKNADGTTNIDAAFKPKASSASASGSSGSSSSASSKIVGPRGVIQVNALTVTAKGFAPQTATVNVSTLTVDAKDLGKLGLAFKGDATYGADKGLLGGDLTVQGLITPAGDIAADKAKVVGTVEARKLPVAVADALANQNGLLVSLLGKELNIEIKTDISQAGGDASVKADSENLTVDLAVTKQGDAITLGKGTSAVKLSIKRDAINDLMKKNAAPATLKKDVNIALTIKSLSVPMLNGAVDTNKLKLAAELTADDVLLDITSNNIGAFEWKGTRLVVEIPEALEKEAKVTLTGGSPTTGGVNVLASVRNLTGAKVIGVDAKVDNIPLNVVDTLAKQEGKLVALLGEKLELVRVQAALNADQQGSVSLTIKSGNLNGGVYANLKPSGVSLDGGQKSAIGLAMSPAAFAKFMGPNPAMTLKQPLTVDLKLNTFNLPKKGEAYDTDNAAADIELVLGDIAADMPGKPAINWARTTISVKSAALAEAVTVKMNGGSPASGKLDLTAQVTKPMDDKRTIKADGELTQFPVALADAFGAQEGKLVALLGERLELVKIKADLNADQTGNASLSIKSLNLNGGLGVAMKADGVALDGAQKNEIAMVMSPAAFAKFMGANPPMTLKQPLAVDLKLNAFSLPKKADAYVTEKLAADVQVVVGDIAADIPGKPPVNWAKTTVSVKTAALGEALAVVAKGGSEASGKLDMTVDVTKPLDDKRTVAAKGELTSFPVAVADAFGAQDGKLVALIGAQIKSLKFGADMVPAKPIRATVDLLADQAEAKLGVTVDTAAKTAVVDAGNYVKLTLTPAASAKLMPPTPPAVPAAGAPAAPAPAGPPQNFKHTEAVDFEVQFADKVQVGWLEVPVKVAAVKPADAKTATDAAPAAPQTTMALDPARTSFNIKVKHNKGALLMTRTGESMKLGAGEYTIKSTNPGKEISINGQSALQGVKTGATIPPGEFKIEKVLVRNMKFEGFAPVTKNFDVDARLGGKNIPVEAVDTYMAKNGQYSSILGSDLDFGAGLGTEKTIFHLDGTGVPEMTGPLDAQLTTRLAGKQVATADLAGDLKGGKFTATKDNVVSIMMTEELSKQYLEKIAPVIQAMSGERASSVTLKKGYTAIASPFDMKSLAGTINVDLGTLKLMKGGTLTSLFSTLAKFYAPAQKLVDSDYSAAFTPVDVATAGGKASYTGWNMNAGPVQLAFDGNVDYVNSVIDSMTIHVKGETFKDVKALANTIKPGESVKIKVTGTLSKPKLDFGDLIALGAKAAAGNLLKGETGEKVNNLLDGVLGGKKSEEKSPTTQEAPKKDEKKDDVGNLINEGFNLFGPKKDEKKK